MKVLLLFLLFSISFFSCLGQNKKQQIEILTVKLDSMQSLIESERDIALKTMISLNERIKSLESDLRILEAKCDRQSKQDEKEINRLEKILDSLNIEKSIIPNDVEISHENLDSISITKKEVLTQAIGVYKLHSISGALGVNTLFDTYKESGRWKSFSSNVIDGKREATQIKLTNKDAMLLNDLVLEVDKNLHIKLLSGRKLLVEIPFNENGMDYKVESDTNSYFKDYNSNTIFSENQLILLASDNIDFSGVIFGNFDVIASDHLLLTYSQEADAFYLDIFRENCCDKNLFVFKRQK